MYHPPPCRQISWQPHHGNNGALLAPHQLGYGTLQGAEAAVHAARLFLDNLQPSKVILKLDFKNAFNTIWCDKMLNAVRSFVSELAPFIHSVTVIKLTGAPNLSVTNPDCASPLGSPCMGSVDCIDEDSVSMNHGRQALLPPCSRCPPPPSSFFRHPKAPLHSVDCPLFPIS